MKPQDVISPKKRWTLIDVLIDSSVDGGTGKEHSLAIGKFDDRIVLASRWNGDDESPLGNPTSRGIATWYILPEWFNAAIVENLPVEKKALAKELLGLTKK